jgi:hypothetical protein
MLRIVTAICLTLVGTSSLSAQQIQFDDQHHTDGEVYLTHIDGIEVPVDIEGNPIDTNPVFRMDATEIEANGWGKTVLPKPVNGVRSGGASFNLTYLDQVNGTGAGFADPVHGQARRTALESAFEYYSSMIEDLGSADIEIRESFSANPNSNPFGFSAAYYFGSKGFNSPFTSAHITSGNDPYGNFPDGYLQFNFHPNLNYNYSVYADPSNQQFDFYTIALHEILHLLGFSSYSNGNGESAASPHVFTSFDEYLADINKNEMFSVTGSGASIAVSVPDDGMLNNHQVWFELYPGQHAPVYSPNPFNGSSLDHFDNDRSIDGEYLMHPSLSQGDAFKMLHEDEVRVLEKLGYLVNYSVATAIHDHDHEVPEKVQSGLYPNPAHSTEGIHIDLGHVEDSEVLVIVVDMLGREAYSKVILNNGAGPVIAIDPHNNLTPGMYIVIGSTQDELFNEKLVIK